MRRIELDIGGKSAYWGNDKCVAMRHKDWLLVRAVVRAAENWSYNDGTCEVAELIKAIEAFDAKPRSKP